MLIIYVNQIAHTTGKGVNDVRRTLSILLILLAILPTAVLAKKADQVTITVAVSPEARFETRISVSNSAKLAKQILSSLTIETNQHPERPRATIAIGKRSYVYDTLDQLFETTGNNRKVILTSSLQQTLEVWVKKAEELHFGQLSNWSEVKTQFRKMSYAKVIDMETGNSFQVQRRAGTRHADVQPLTKADSKTMKRIYEGKWSWRRRAILVEINGKQYAASMHGMPHGAGGIKGNGFPGHFCIHFQGSSTHRRKTADPGHQLMIFKASGRLPELIQQAEPNQLVSYFLTALHEKDLPSMAMTMENIRLPINIEDLEAFAWKVDREAKLDDDLLAVEIPAKVRYQVKGKKVQNRKWTIVAVRGSLFDRWKISGLAEEQKSG